MKEKIQEIIDQLNLEINDLVLSSQPVKPENSLGRLTRMDAIAAQKINAAALERLRIRVEKLNAAIKRIDDGEYGICLSCGEEIPEKRLKAIPEATLCIDCSESQIGLNM